MDQSVYWGPSETNLLFMPGYVGVDIESNHMEQILEYWLRSGVDMECRSDKGITPLLNASVTFGLGTTNTLLLLIKYGADVRAVNDQGQGALHLVLITLNLLSHSTYEDSKHWHQYESEGATRLIALLDAGCDPNAIDGDGLTPLQRVQDNRLVSAFWMTVWQDTIEHMKLRAA
jgi:hypothetical protein